MPRTEDLTLKDVGHVTPSSLALLLEERGQLWTSMAIGGGVFAVCSQQSPGLYIT